MKTKIRNQKAESGNREAGPAILTISSIAELTQRIQKPIEVVFSIDGENIRLPARRLMDTEEAKIQSILHELGNPPFDEKVKEYLFSDPKYLEKKARLQSEMSAVRIYTAVPAIAAGKPGLTDRGAIREYVTGLLPANIREITDATIQLGGVGVVERVNFFSTPDSAQS